MEHEIEANAIDESSGGERRNMRNKTWAHSIITKELEPFKELISAGVELKQAQKIIPKTIEELDMMEKVGNFKLKWETGIEQLLKDAFYISDWETIKYQVYEDIFDLGMLATCDYTSKDTGKAKVRYVDIERLISRNSRNKRYDNIDFAGEILDISPNTIRIDANEDLTEDVIEQILEFNNQRDNISYESVDDYYTKHGSNTIQVLQLKWKSIDVIKQEKRVNKRGDTIFSNISFGQESRNEIIVAKKQMVYTCNWIIGTDYVYNFGHDEDIIRPTPNTVKLPYNIYKISNKSILELIIPSADNIEIAWMKFQNTLAKAAPPGIAVDVGALKNVTNGKNTLKPLEILQIRRETGDLLYSSTTHHNQIINANSARPMFDLPGGGGTMLEEQMKIIDWDINMIRQLTGINELMDATAPAPNTLVGTAKIAEQGTNNTLYMLYNAYKAVKEGTASNLAYRIQSIIYYKDYKPFENVIGTSMLEIFKAGSPISTATFGISLKLKATITDKQEMLQKALGAYQQKYISYSDLLTVEDEIKNGSLKAARMYMMYKEEKYKEEEAARVQANTENQSKAIIDQQENAKAGRMEEADHLSELKIEEIYAKAEADAKEYAQKNSYKKEEDNNASENKIKEELLKK